MCILPFFHFLPHFILPSISWSTSQSCFHIHYNTLLGILFSSILCTCPNRSTVIFVTLLSLLWCFFYNCMNFSFSLSYTGDRILLYTFLSKMFNCFLPLSGSVEVSDAYVTFFLFCYCVC
jgi:hypothetical protein